ncbi:MAG: hypothetical protein GKR95_00680 [Gammaproteobacteria bacterium]|nr:hypothetical protein [Gammaproteobacteria bacterium]
MQPRVVGWSLLAVPGLNGAAAAMTTDGHPDDVTAETNEFVASAQGEGSSKRTLLVAATGVPSGGLQT